MLGQVLRVAGETKPPDRQRLLWETLRRALLMAAKAIEEYLK